MNRGGRCSQCGQWSLPPIGEASVVKDTGDEGNLEIRELLRRAKVEKEHRRKLNIAYLERVARLYGDSEGGGKAEIGEVVFKDSRDLLPDELTAMGLHFKKKYKKVGNGEGKSPCDCSFCKERTLFKGLEKKDLKRRATRGWIRALRGIPWPFSRLTHGVDLESEGCNSGIKCENLPAGSGICGDKGG